MVAKFPGNFKSAVKNDKTFGQPDPVQKFGEEGQDGAVQNCCPKVNDPKVTSGQLKKWYFCQLSFLPQKDNILGPHKKWSKVVVS